MLDRCDLFLPFQITCMVTISLDTMLVLSGSTHSVHPMPTPSSTRSLTLTATTRITKIMPLASIVSSCYLTPKFGTTYHLARWLSTDVLEECKSFTNTTLQLHQHKQGAKARPGYREWQGEGEVVDMKHCPRNINNDISGAVGVCSLFSFFLFSLLY